MSAAGRKRVGQRSSDVVRAAREWQRQNPWPTDLGYFEREVAPKVAQVAVRELVEATGLSSAYCRRIRDGRVVPHPMWWAPIERIANARRTDQSNPG